MKKTSAQSLPKKFYNKKELFSGIVFLSAAFVFIFVIFYLVVKTHQRQLEAYDSLQEKMEAINIERVAVEEMAAELKAKVGTSVSLDNLMAQAQKTYGPEEKNRREGVLWIDRAAKSCYITLGAVQGLAAGDKLKVFEGTTEIGAVRVETPLDVISYVRPINKELDDFGKDYYRVVRP